MKILKSRRQRGRLMSMGIYFRVKETATNLVKFGVIPVRFRKNHLKKAKESLESLSSCGKMLVKFTEHPRKSSGNPRKSSGNLRKSTGNPRKSSGNPRKSSGNPRKSSGNPRKSSENLLKIRGCPEEFQEIRGNPLEIHWKSEDVQCNSR